MKVTKETASFFKTGKLYMSAFIETDLKHFEGPWKFIAIDFISDNGELVLKIQYPGTKTSPPRTTFLATGPLNDPAIEGNWYREFTEHD